MSHRARLTDSPATLPTTTYAQPPQTTKTSRSYGKKGLATIQRLSMTSNSSSGRRSSASYEGTSGPTTSRPSSIPRPTRTSSSSSKPSPLISSKPTFAGVNRQKTTSNAPGVAARIEIRRRPQDRFVPSNVTPRIVTDEDLASLEPNLPSLDMDHDTVFGIAMPAKYLPPSTNLPPRLIPELQALAASAQRRPTPAMSTISTVSSPSTQFTTSPSPWSASTNATTPTSWSSVSPPVVQSARPQPTTKRSQTVPVPSIARTQMPKLPILQESAASSVSSSRANFQIEEACTLKKIKKKTPLNSPAPTPPPRTSSVKRNRSRSNSQSESLPNRSVEDVPPLPQAHDVSPVERHVKEMVNRSKQMLPAQDLTDHHKKLQDAINFVPPRPSRDGVGDLDLRMPQRVILPQSEDEKQARKLLDAAPIETLPSKPGLGLHVARSLELEHSSSLHPTRSRLAKFSKLAFFGKSSRSTSKVNDLSQLSQNLSKRGPAAGTGHEGYGKFGRKERKLPVDGNSTETESDNSSVSTRRRPVRTTSRKTSANTSRDRSSQSDLDDFVASRLKPVVILGGSLKGSRSENSNSQQQILADRVNTGVVEASDTKEQDPKTRINSSGPLMRESRLIFHLDSLESHKTPTLALRRSQKIENAGKLQPLQEIDTSLSLSQPFRSGYNTSQSSLAPSSAAMTDTSVDLYKVDSQQSSKQRKKSRKLNWGFFRRKESVPETPRPQTTSRNTTPHVAVAVATLPPARPVPYYAMLESETEFASPEVMSNAETINEYLNEATQGMVINDNEDVVSPIDNSESEPLERANSILLPSAPQLRRDRDFAQQADSHQGHPDSHPGPSLPIPPTIRPRQPRLAQVGRIPKVVPTTHTTVAPHSAYSDPVQHDVYPVRQDLPSKSTQASVPPPVTARMNRLPDIPSQDAAKGKASIGPALSRLGKPSLVNQIIGRDLSKLPDRYSTTSSSSDGVISVMGPALIPAPEFPTRSIRYTTTEDDIWNEYDEFIDRVISPPRLKKSRARITDDDKIQPYLRSEFKKTSEPMPSGRQPPRDLSIVTSLAPPPPLFFSSPSSVERGEMEQAFRLRRSRIVSALHSSLDPSSPFSIGDYLAELGEHRWNHGRTSGRLSDSTVSQGGLNSPVKSFVSHEPPAIQPEYRHYENAVHMDELERSKNPARHSERSYASLMVSRWLSFGRVLFSPAHTDLQKQPERHVLVIDGLGNEDWSMYCAVTYQNEQAYIYDLKETGHTGSSTNKGINTPPNFRRREVASFNESFKFPDNFFSVIMLRFPPVMAESKLKNIISQCRRILAPGGYMELMLLDLDIVNMGVVTRRAMRDLKTRIAMRNREVSLKPVIDNIQGILGEKGFSKLSKCIVGVPVVGRPPGADSPVSSRSSGTSEQYRWSPSAGPKPFNGLESRNHHNFSLNDLVADHSDNADAKIGRVVSRTARSWWQHCFEAAVIPDGNLSKSIFADKHVLNECKTRASSFKLLIAYTQKPVNPALGIKRRTMSEPVIATLATAGTS